MIIPSTACMMQETYSFMTSPYSNLPYNRFWKKYISSAAIELKDSGTNNKVFDSFSGLYSAKYPITVDSKVLTAGSCFSEHITNLFLDFNGLWLESEGSFDSKTPYLPSQDGNSFKIGNSYTPNSLQVWIDNAVNKSRDFEICDIYECEHGFIDGLRPKLIHKGNSSFFSSPDQISQSRLWTLKSISESLKKATHFIVTLGMTECHESSSSGFILPLHLGSIESTVKGFKSVTKSLSYQDILESTSNIVSQCQKINKDIKFLFTVSPVPMVATHRDRHVLVSHWDSKSILRSAVSKIVEEFDSCDYFPSFEIVNSLSSTTNLFAENMRSPSGKAVDLVKKTFLDQNLLGSQSSIISSESESRLTQLTNKCEELTYEANSSSPSLKDSSNNNNILLLGDSHIACLSKAFHKLSVDHDTFTIGGSMLGRGQFDLCDQYFWRFYDKEIQQTWHDVFLNTFLNQRLPRKNESRIIVTNIPIGSITLQHQAVDYFNYDEKQLTSASSVKWSSCFKEIRGKHINLLVNLRRHCDKLLLVFPPSVKGANEAENFLIGKLMKDLYIVHTGQGWKIVNTPLLMKRMGDDPTQHEHLSRLIQSDDGVHGSDECYEWLSSIILDMI